MPKASAGNARTAVLNCLDHLEEEKNTMPHRLFAAIANQDLIGFDELLAHLRLGPLTVLRDGEGRSLLEAAQAVGLQDAVSERLYRLYQQSLEDDAGRSLADYVQGLPDERHMLDVLLDSDDSVGGSDAEEVDGSEAAVPYVLTEQEAVAERAVAALSDSVKIEHGNLAAECVCLVTGQPFVPSVEALAPIKLPDFPDATGSVISRGAARKLLAAERDPIYGARVPVDPVTRRPLDAKAILSSSAFLQGNAQRAAMVDAVLKVFAQPGEADVPELCRRAYEAAEQKRGLFTASEPISPFLSAAYTDAVLEAAVGGMRNWQAVMAAAAAPRVSNVEAGSSPPSPGPG